MRSAPFALLALLAAPAVLAQAPTAAPITAGFTDLRWQRRTLPELKATATVVYFATLECPLVQRYLPRLQQLAHDYRAQGVVVLVVNVGPGDHLVDAVGQVAQHVPDAVFGKDFDGSFANACGVDRTGVALLLDGEQRVRYRGRIDDQHAYTSARPAPTRADLQLALDELLAGQPVSVPATEAMGCKITPPVAAGDGPAPTWSGEVAKIVFQHCVACHRPDGEGPFPMLDLAQVRKHGAMVAEVVEQGRMPPWYGSSKYGTFVNHRGLGEAERATLVRWVAAGMPAGDGPPPPLPKLPDGNWRIGEPDLVVTVKAPVRLPADGTVPYKYFVLPHRFEHDTWVEAIEIKPENERVLHHCNLARVKLGEKFSQDGFITGYVPGGDPFVMDPGTAVKIPAGSVLALQAHYVTIGEAATDRLSVGLRFPKVPVQKEAQVTIVADQRFSIPPGAMAHPVRASRKLPDDAVGIGLFVHMHLRGRDLLATAKLPDGSLQPLLLVPNYNFDWQQSYRWAPGALRLPKGTRIAALAHFDNSAWNPFNPDPTVAVPFGLETTDEMMYLFAFWVREQEALGLEVDPRTGVAVGR